MAKPLEPLFSERRALVEEYLAKIYAGSDVPERLLSAMSYSLLAGGKRLRPVLCLTSASLFGETPEHVLPFACAIEMIHTYSLIHDDLPCMDDDDLRRGRPSNHKAFGEATALLAGDGLLTDAFALMTKAELSPVRLLPAMRELALSAGSNGMVGGQEHDMECTGRERVELEELRRLHARKTGALLRASASCGALLAGAKEQDLSQISVFGQELGIAFQIVDDILDETSDPAVLGKPVHSDAEKNKATYPAVVGLDESRRLAREHAERACAALAGFSGPDCDFLAALATYTVERVS